jgi:perosamine synthetase
MVVTNDDRLADMCRSLRNQGRAVAGRGAIAPGSTAGAWLHHERLGFNYRMSEVNAALGVAQMERLDQIIAGRQRVANRYMQRLLDVNDLVLPTIPEGAEMSWFVFVVRLAAGFTKEERDRVIKSMRNHDIGAADYFPCIHLQPFYRQAYGFREGDFPIAESVSNRTIALPFFSALTDREIDLVVQTLQVMISRENLARR